MASLKLQWSHSLFLLCVSQTHPTHTPPQRHANKTPCPAPRPHPRPHPRPCPRPCPKALPKALPKAPPKALPKALPQGPAPRRSVTCFLHDWRQTTVGVSGSAHSLLRMDGDVHGPLPSSFLLLGSRGDPCSALADVLDRRPQRSKPLAGRQRAPRP